MNIPDKRNTHCKKCNTHTEHKVTQYKKAKDRPNSQGARRYRRKQRGYHGQTKPIQRRKAKLTKKLAIRLRCMVCDSKHQQVMRRAKHVEFGGKKKTKGQALVY